MTTPTTVNVRLKLRSDTASNWTSANPTLLAGELGRETDTGKIKIGNGSTAWTSLAYQAWATLPIAVSAGGTGQTSYTDGQLLIGNSTGNTLTKSTLTAGTSIQITNGNGSITIASTALPSTGGTVTGAITAPAFIPNGSTVPTNGVYLPAANSVAISTNGSGRLFVDSSGSVGIGASAPGAKLDVTESTNASLEQLMSARGGNGLSSQIRFLTKSTGGGNTGGAIGHSDALGGLILTGSATSIASAQNVVITSNGRVGIGTSSPSQLIHGASSGAATLFLQNTSGNNTGITLQNDGQGTSSLTYNRSANTLALSGPNANITFVNANQAIAFTTNGEAARIDSSKRLLVGTSTARSTGLFGTSYQSLIENGGSYAGLMLYGNANNIQGSYIGLGKSRGTTANSFTVVQNNDILGYLGFEGADGTSSILAASIEAQVDGTPGANDMPGRLVFSTTSDGANATTERLRITSTGQVRLAGAGITFNGDTATANELDDYEEGTWTPAVVETTPTASYTTRLGVYTKIGQQVHVGCTIVYTGATGSGGLVISGLPFTSRNTTGLRITSAVTLTAIPLTVDNVPYCEITANSSQVAIGQMPIAGGSLAAVPFDPAGSIFFTISYFV